MPKTILIVDDLSANRRILNAMLCEDYDIIEADSGAAALEILSCQRERISAVLLDIVMPDIDGYEVLKRMRHTLLLSQIPVIMITGIEEEEARSRVLEMGANDFVLKPYKSDILKHCLKNNIALREAAATVNALLRDRLTGLFSREAFFDTVQYMVQAHEPGYYIMACFDIDRFKVVNDQYGTKKGDEVLRYIAQVFQEGFAAQGGIVCRVAADDFAVLYPASFQDSDALLDMRNKASAVDGLVSPLTFSIGRYLVDDLSLSPSAMYDRAMLATNSIKGRYDAHIAYYNESLRKHIILEQEIVTEMESALLGGQFEAWFQPQYNHSTGALIGAEALARWRHPEKGLIPPGVFIPIFEKNGFVYELDKCIWEQVCQQLRRWIDEKRNPLPVSVNISRYDIFREDVVSVITGLVAKYRLPVDLLRLEITESAFSKSAEQIIAVVRQLLDAGFTVEIDDFGSGYSSLNTLKDVPAQVIKLDMKFLESSANTQRGGNIVESIVRMAKWLDMSVIAEGVETIEQADFLRSIGCNYIQGYLYARPMPVVEYEALCKGAGKEEHLLALETVENLDNNAFWDPESMDTLIFNSYVGGACIYEYHNGTIELLRATKKYAQIFDSPEMTVESILKLNWAEHIDKATLQRITAALEESIAAKTEITEEYIFRNLPGCPVETHLRSTMRVIASAGNRYLVYCTNHNITAQRKAEQDERATAARMQLIMNAMYSGISALAIGDDGKPQIVFANDKYFDMLGYTREQAEKELVDFTAVVHPDDQPMARAALVEMLDNRIPFVSEYRCIRRDGSEVYIRGSKSVTSIEGYGEDIVISVISDITELMQAKQQSAMLSEQMQAVMDNVDLGITASLVKKGTVQFLFSNDKYYDILGYTRAQYEAEGKDTFICVHPEDRQRVMQKANELVRTHESAVVDYRAVRRDNRVIWLRAAVAMGRFSGIEEPVQLAIYRDVTADKQAEQALLETDEQLRFLNGTAHALLAQPDVEEGINGTLLKLMEYFQGARAYIFEFNEETQQANNTYEVCAEGVTKERANLQEVPFSELAFWFEAFETSGYYGIDRVADLPSHRAEERERLLSQGISSLFAVPLNRDGKRIGMIGVDDPHRKLTQTDRLVALGDYIAVMLTRRDLNAQIQRDYQTLNRFINDMPGGFARIRLFPDGSMKVRYVNEGLCRLMGMRREQVLQIYAEDALAGVHPEDVPVVQDVVSRMLEQGNAYSSRYRLRYGGGYIWMMIFGRVTKDEVGDTYLNIYYTDVSEQVREEERQKELLDNLPYGAALYEYDGTALTVIHRNKRYWELVQRPPVTDKAESVVSTVHPDDRQILLREMEAAATQRRDAACNVRILCGENEYRPFHCSGCIVPKENGHISLYASYTPILENEITFQESIPIVLSAIMECSTDLSFAKDREFRYICASRAFAHMVGVENERSLIGKTDYDIFPQELADKFRKDDMALIAEGKPIIDMVEPILSDDGTAHYSNTSKFILRDTGGNVIGLYGVGRDITKSLNQDSQLALLNDSIPGGLATYAHTDKGLKITYCNNGFCKLFGGTHDGFIQRGAFDPVEWVFEEDRPELLRQVDALVKNDAPIDCLYRIHLIDGGYKWINEKAVAAQRHDGTVFFNALLLDVTERMQEK
ncbi:MAG: EAL domain-containing protein [Eubacteriales bacterium]|nr:EAL domain-containing protein [Eubacteriales bacterium]